MTRHHQRIQLSSASPVMFMPQSTPLLRARSISVASSARVRPLVWDAGCAVETTHRLTHAPLFEAFEQHDGVEVVAHRVPRREQAQSHTARARNRARSTRSHERGQQSAPFAGRGAV